MYNSPTPVPGFHTISPYPKVHDLGPISPQPCLLCGAIPARKSTYRPTIPLQLLVARGISTTPSRRPRPRPQPPKKPQKLSQSRRLYTQPAGPAPVIDRSKSKLWPSAKEAVADIQSGSTLLSAGFGLCGVADTLINALRDRGPESLHSLTAISNNAGIEGVGGLASLTTSGQVEKLIISFLGNNKTLEKQYLNGGIAIELCPQGTLAERIRAGGAGIPAFYTPTAVDTYVQDGKIPVAFSRDGRGDVVRYGTPREVREFGGRRYLMETALTGDVAILRAWKVDEAGNCVFR